MPGPSVYVYVLIYYMWLLVKLLACGTLCRCSRVILAFDPYGFKVIVQKLGIQHSYGPFYKGLWTGCQTIRQPLNFPILLILLVLPIYINTGIYYYIVFYYNGTLYFRLGQSNEWTRALFDKSRICCSSWFITSAAICWPMS